MERATDAFTRDAGRRYWPWPTNRRFHLSGSPKPTPLVWTRPQGVIDDAAPDMLPAAIRASAEARSSGVDSAVGRFLRRLRRTG